MHWVAFLVLSVFCFWVVFRDGAEVLEGWLAATVMDFFAGALTANYLKAYAAILWLVSFIALASDVVAHESRASETVLPGTNGSAGVSCARSVCIVGPGQPQQGPIEAPGDSRKQS